jgi:hypothetical protein
MMDLFQSSTRVHAAPRDGASEPLQAVAGVDEFLEGLWSD